MSFSIRTAAVLGGGVMGSGIAAHLANAGIKTYLLDMVPNGVGPEQSHEARSAFAVKGIELALKFKPAPLFYDKGGADLVIPGNFDDDLSKIAECDLIIEAIIENLEIKKQLFAKIAPFMKPDAILSSNTSGLCIADMAEALPMFTRDRFLVTHFFNPVRFMKLLELVAGPDTSEETMKIWADFGTKRLGKGVVFGKDTPNFIANRIGIYSMVKTIHAMLEDGYTVEEVDAIFGKPLGRPKSAAFKTLDMVGLDVFCHVSNTCLEKLPNDPERGAFTVPEFMNTMVKKGLLGAKTKAGFYCKGPKGEKLVMDPKTLEYIPCSKVSFESLSNIKGMTLAERTKTLIASEDRAGKLAWKILAQSLIYSAKRIGEISDDVVNIDNGMKWGFNWEMGPFETWDAIGVADSVKRMQADGYEVPKLVLDMLAAGVTSFYGRKGVNRTYYDFVTKSVKEIANPAWSLVLDTLREQGRIVKKNLGANLVDLGDGVACLEFRTKMNTIDDDVMAMMHDAVDVVEDRFEGLVISNDGEHFGVGANIGMVLMAARAGNWDMLEKVIRYLQLGVMRFKYCSKPVVAAPFGMTFGGCAEICLHASALRPHAELYMGLVEAGVGVIPAGGGTKEMLVRGLEAIPGDNADLSRLPYIAKVFETIAMAKVSMSAFEARRYGFVRKTDQITLSRDSLLNDAKQTVLGLARAGFTPPPAPDWLVLPGRDGLAYFDAGLRQFRAAKQITPHDFNVAGQLAKVLCGGDIRPGTKVTEQHVLDLECEAFLTLCGMEQTQDRIQHMLDTGKPLRN